MILYGFWRSSAAYRVRIALNIKGLSYSSRPVNLRIGGQRDPDYLALNPQGLVPTLITEQNALTQSLAIIEYLEEQYPQPSLLPREPIARAKIRAAALSIAADIHPINNIRVLNYLRSDLDLPPLSVDSWIKHWIQEGFSALEKIASSGPYLFGKSVTMADICLVPQMYNARRFGAVLRAYPKLAEIERNLAGLDAFERARPENQPDADIRT